MPGFQRYICHGRRCYRKLAIIAAIIFVVIHLNLFSPLSFKDSGLPLLRTNSPSTTSLPVFKNISDIAGSTTATLVVSSTSSEDTNWISEYFPNISNAVYIVDTADPRSHFKTPVNKGNEAMVYLTYIIDHYDILPDVAIFVHAHRLSDHTDDLLGGSMVESLQRLRLSKVAQGNYFNMRCNWEPGGCPKYLNLHDPDLSKKDGADQARILKESWRILFSQRSFEGEWVGQPYGGQFAASRDATRRVPLQDWTRWRDWLINTKLSDYHAGRVWEYTWQYVLNDSLTFCPKMYDCYCEGYGICFESEQDLKDWRLKEQQLQDFITDCLKMKPSVEKAIEFKKIAAERREELDRLLEDAKARGDMLSGRR